MTEFYNLGANCIKIFKRVGNLCTHLKQSPTCTLDPSAKQLIDEVETSIIQELSNPLVQQFYSKLSEETKEEVKEETEQETKEGKTEQEEMENIADVVDRVRKDLSEMNGNPKEMIEKLQDQVKSIDFAPIDPENKVKETLNKTFSLFDNVVSGNNSNPESFESIVGNMKDFMKSLCPQLDVDSVVGSIMQAAPPK